jgi:hypothetical protein
MPNLLPESPENFRPRYPTLTHQIVKKATHEEEELHRKREELASVRAVLAERELELAAQRVDGGIGR